MKIGKFVAVILAGVMLTSVVGCSKTQTTDSNNDDEIITVTWNMPKPLDNMSAQKQVEDEVNKILEKEIGVRLKFNLIDNGAWNEKMNMIIASGEAFDICLTSFTGPTSILTNVKRDAYLDLTDLIDQYAPDIKAKVDPRAWKAATFNGKIMAIPSQAKYVPETVYVFKKDLVEKYGFDYKSVTCLEDLEPYLKTLKENEPDIVPLCITGATNLTNPFNENYTATAISGVVFDEKQEKFVDDLSVNKEEYATKHDFYQKGYIAKDAFTKTDASEGQSGKYAVLPDSGAYTEDGSKSSAYYGFPCVETLVGRGLIPPHNMMSGNAISAKSEHPEKIIQMLNLIWKDPYLSNTLAYGIEGVNYSVASGTTNEDKSVIPTTGADRTWTIWHNWIGPLFDQWDSSWNSKEALERMKKDNQEAGLSKTVGFMMDIDNLESEIAALSEVITASQPVFNVGNMDDFESYYQDVENKWKMAGIDKILDELNRQYAEWKASL